MFKFLTKIFKTEEAETVWLHPEPEVQEPKDISEPVISFVQCVKDNPKRFKLKDFYENTGSAYFSSRKFILKDRATGEVFEVSLVCSGRRDYWRFGKLHATITEDELDYIKEELTPVFEAKQEKLYQIQRLRAQRVGSRERQRLMAIYCKEKTNDN